MFLQAAQRSAVFATVIFGGLCLIGLWLVVGALFPRKTSQVHQVIADLPGRAFLIGLVNVVLVLAVAAGLRALVRLTGSWIMIPGVILLAALAIGLALGMAGLVQVIGARLFPARSSFQQQFWSALLLVLGCWTPFIGWFLLFPYAAMTGLGGLVLSFFRRPPAPLPAVEQAPPEPASLNP